MGCSSTAATFNGEKNYYAFVHLDFTGKTITPDVHDVISSFVKHGKAVAHCTGGTGRTAYGLGALMLNYLANDHPEEFRAAYDAG
jgi:protein-tyrosine phosphatase